MKYGQGAKGSVQDTPCMKRDPVTFCNSMIEKRDAIKQMILFKSSGTITLRRPEDFDKVIKRLRYAKGIVTKTFLGKSPKTAFKNEFRSNMVIIKKLSKTYHTLSPGFKWKKGEEIYGLVIKYENSEDDTYHLFSEGCSTQIMNMKFDQRLFNKFIKEIGETLDLLQELGYMHNDIKPDNMIYCKNSDRFKIIDWELVTSVKQPPLKFYNSGNTTFNHSIRFYLGGLPSVVAKRIQSDYGVKRPKYKWVGRLKCFHELNLIMKTSFDYLVEKYSDKDKRVLHRDLAPHFDKYAFAQMLVILAEKYRLKYPQKRVMEYMQPFMPSVV